MKAVVQYKDKAYSINLSEPIDISIPLRAGMQTVNAFYAPYLEIKPVVAGDFVGDTQLGGPVNFKNVTFNPHGNGTHTECVGHISDKSELLGDSLKQYFFGAELLSIYPEKLENGDRVITKPALQSLLGKVGTEALIIRTLPNDELKCQANYSGTNPPYIHHEAISWLVEQGVRHLLLDLPSVDREQDDGLLLAHKAFWQYPDAVRENATITELVYVPNEVKDGFYFLNIQVTSLELDASPSKPVLYAVSE